MAIAVRSGSGNVAGPTGPPATKPPAVQLALPTALSTPSVNLGDFTWVIYGERKIGKTSLASQFPGAFFLMFEPGGKALAIYQKSLTNWREMKGYVQLLKQTPPDQFPTIVIDTVDIAYEKCMDFVGQREGFSHPGDVKDFGKSWDLVKKEFASVIQEIVATGRGVVFISHAVESEFTNKEGKTYNKIIPSMSGQVRKFVSGFVDVIAFYGYNGNARYLSIRGSDSLDAGHRIDRCFKTPEGSRIFAIPMGESPEDGFENIIKAFNNEQSETFEDDTDKNYLAEDKKKKPGSK